MFANRLRSCLWPSLGLGLIVVLLSAGCRSPSGAEDPPASPGSAATAQTGWLPPSLRTNQTPAPGTNQTPVLNTNEINPTVVVLRPGEEIKVVFSDLPPQVTWMPVEVAIGEDGIITLPLNIKVQAAGKTANQLQEDIRKAYVPKYVKYLTITVKTKERFYFVSGDVRIPGRYPYYGYITVLRAIATAGGFGDFADRKRVELRRANGQIFKIDAKKAIKNPKLDLEVMPGDEVFVHRRFM